jgi:PAS domain-containing protein
VRKDGTLLWANVILTAIYDEHGTLRGYSKITRDLTERRMQEQRLKESEENFRLLIEGVKDHAIILLDSEASCAAGTPAPSACRAFSATR